MHELPYTRIYLLFCLFLVLGWSATVSGSVLNWTNENTGTVYNHPDKPTLVSFSGCVKILSITTNHWNYGTGDTPGKINLFHDDGTSYGPWGTVGMNGTNDAPNVYWVSRPGEILKGGTYTVSDSGPGTWGQNDASDNRGIVTISYEPVNCPNETGETPGAGDELVQTPSPVPEGMEDGVTMNPGDVDPGTLTGGANDTETVPVIEQVVFRPISDSIHGGDPAYVMLRVKNTGYRALDDGYVTIRFISKDGLYSYRAGTAKIPPFTAGEERDIPLIIRTEGPQANGTGTNTLYCTEYLLDGSINELMEGGYFEKRGELSMPREKFIKVTGCCQEPYTGDSFRGCRGG